MRNLGTRFIAKILLICALGLPTAAHGLQLPRPPLETTIAEPVARHISLKIPLAGIQFHWCFMNRDELLSGKLTLEVRRGDTTNEIVIFEGGSITSGWSTSLSASPCGESFYFLFFSTTPYLTAPGDELEIELHVLKDLSGIGPNQTGVLAASTYRVKGTYFNLVDEDDAQPMSAAQLIDSLTEQGVTRDEAEMMAQTLQGVSLAMRMNAEAFSFIAYTGCWENLWPLKITSNEGWASPEQIAFQERNLEIERAAIERAGGPNCSGPA